MDTWWWQYGNWGTPQAVGVNDSRGSRVWWLLCSPFPSPPPYCFSLGAWQHPSRWRVYFCFCLFTYSCIQLFGASQGLSFHHRMQIATAANPLSSLPCRHPTSLHVSPSLTVRTSLFQLWDQACSDQASLAPTQECQTQYTSRLPFFFSSSHSALSSHSFILPLTLAPHRGSCKQESSITAIPPGIEGCRKIPNWVREDVSGSAHQVVTLKPSRIITRKISLFISHITLLFSSFLLCFLPQVD